MQLHCEIFPNTKTSQNGVSTGGQEPMWWYWWGVKRKCVGINGSGPLIMP